MSSGRGDRDPQPDLRRELGPFGLTVYGVGGMLGGGIYALVGEVAGAAGHLAWAAFAVAMAAAFPTALAYGQLARRFPRSGGESVFVHEAFGSDALALLVGWTVMFSGMVSMGTLAHAFAGYAVELWSAAPRWPILCLFLLALGAINFRGMRETSTANIAATGIELGGLLMVIGAGAAFLLGDGGSSGAGAPGDGSAPAWAGVLPGATLAFYAFIGFEDMVNVAEEVREPRRTLPRALVTAVLVVGTVYVIVNALATRVVAPAALAGSPAPLTRVIETAAPVIPPAVFTVIALFAVANSALLNFVMASRLAYGMAKQELLPGWLARIHPGRHTPHRAIGAVLVLTVVLALTGTLGRLAGATSLLLLTVFMVVNGALLWIRHTEPEPPPGGRLPALVPVTGLATSGLLLVFGSSGSILTAMAIVAAGGAIVALRRIGLW